MNSQYRIEYISIFGRAQRFLVFMGFPVSAKKPLFDGAAWLTWTLSILMILVFISPLIFNHFYQSFISIPYFAQNDFLFSWEGQRAFLGLDPDLPFRFQGLNLVSNFFIHGDFFHLFGNLYFLILFGPAVEKRLGAIRFLLLLGMASISGTFLQCYFTPDLAGTMFGASDALSGIVTFYAFEFVEAEIGFLPPILSWLAIWWVPLFPAWALIFVWGLKELMFSLFLPHTGIAYAAHFGGFAFGLFFWLLSCFGD